MKKLKNIALLALALGTAACKDSFLAEKPFSSYTPATLNDSLGVEASLVGLYNHTSTIFTWSNQQGWLSVWQVGTDVANATANQQGIEIPYYNYNLLTPTDGAAALTWDRNFILINLSNIIINSLDSPNLKNITSVGKNKMSAEAKFFRAYAYNNLATCFGGVPLLTQALTAPKTDFTRASVDEVNNQIVSDLSFAISNLPDIEEVKSNTKGKLYGRANKYMAMQLLGEVYLRMGKPELAETQLKAIIDSGKFKLVKNRYGIKTNLKGDYYSDMFVYGNQRRIQGNTEAIWVLEQENPSTVVGGNTGSAQQRRVWGAAYHNVRGMSLSDSTGGRALGRLRLSNWVIYNLYKDGDIRNSSNNIRRRYVYNDPAQTATYGKPVPYAGTDTLFNLAPHITKWYQFDPNDTFGFAMIKDFILMRLGETYLLLAEAQVQQGKLQDAANTINVLRARAFVNYPAQGQVSASDMSLDFILDERARELIGEENRRMTLMRTKKLVDRVKRLNANSAVNPVQGIADKHLLLPIPLNEIQLNKDGVLQQNPGY